MDTSAVYIPNDKIVVFHEYVKACLEHNIHHLKIEVQIEWTSSKIVSKI